MRDSERDAGRDFRREFEGAELGDRRLSTRLVGLAELIRASPSDSFPDMMDSAAELTALYRFLNNENVSPSVVLEPHLRQSAQRCAEAGRVVVAHDTTELSYPGEARRQGLGRLRGENDQGLLLHTSLAIANDGSRRPLGVLAAHTWTRPELGRSRHPDGRKKDGGSCAGDADKESARWWKLIRETEDRLGGVDVLHVFDREGDAYALLSAAIDESVHFVTRMAHDRVILDEDGERIGRTSEVLLDVVDVLTVEVALSPRKAVKTPRTTEAPRLARTARLAVGAAKIRLAAPRYVSGHSESAAVNVVYVHEVKPAPDIEPIAWVLITSEPVDTREQIRAVIDAYRLRWTIEEFFKALKTGCALEKRQLESYDSITTALALFLPIAWHLLLLRSLARTEPDQPAGCVLSPDQLEVLRAAVPKPILPPAPSVADALRAVAYLGGHFIKRPPGWLVLGRGLEKLLTLELGWQMARAAQRCDRT